MKAKNQRLVLIGAALVALITAVLLAMSAVKDQAAFYYAPGDIAGKPLPLGKAVRLGGMVEKGSIRKQSDGITIDFVVTDGITKVPVRFTGVAPDLFREGSGVVAEGQFQADRSFVASNLLAKHDERYMPPQAAGARPVSEKKAQ